MKKLCLIICLLISWLAKSQTNTYHPFPTDDAAWNVYFYAYGGHSGWYYQYNYKFYLKNDTVIDSKNYKTIATVKRYQNHNESTSDYSSGEINYPNPIAAIREEDKKIYVIYFNFPNFLFPDYSAMPVIQGEHLLYDFNLQVGDSIYHDYPGTSYSNCKLISIDSVFLVNSYRKTYDFSVKLGSNLPDTTRVIEGIGSLTGPFMDLFPFRQHAPSLYKYLMCYGENHIIEYSYNGNCNTIVLDVEENTLENKVNVYPNPASSDINIQINIPSFKGYYTLYSYTGSCIKSAQIQNSAINITTADLANGMYLLQIGSNDGAKNICKKIFIE